MFDLRHFQRLALLERLAQRSMLFGKARFVNPAVAQIFWFKDRDHRQRPAAM
jgi:hypothetical protein